MGVATRTLVWSAGVITPGTAIVEPLEQPQGTGSHLGGVKSATGFAVEVLVRGSI